jgi:hypothetical protein
MAGLTWKAMLAAAERNPDTKARTDFYSFRVPEEFYDLTKDRFERSNLIADPERKAEIEAMRKELLSVMQRTGDPFAEAFVQRDNKDFVASVLEKVKQEYGGKKRSGALKAP